MDVSEHDAIHVGPAYLKAFLSLASTDEFADLGHQHIHGGDGLTIIVQPHVERLCASTDRLQPAAVVGS